MKGIFFICLVNILCVSCNSQKDCILDNGYLGMTTAEYKKVFKNDFEFKADARKVPGKLKPDFKAGHLTSLSFYIDDISDYETAYSVYQLGNDFSNKYGTPVENKETVWAGGSSKFFKWKKGRLEVAYSYNYNQVPGTNGLLYTGDAKVVYNSHAN